MKPLRLTWRAELKAPIGTLKDRVGPMTHPGCLSPPYWRITAKAAFLEHSRIKRGSPVRTSFTQENQGCIRVHVLKYRMCIRTKKRGNEKEEERGRRDRRGQRGEEGGGRGWERRASGGEGLEGRGQERSEEGDKREWGQRFPCSLGLPAFILFLDPPWTITELHSRIVHSIQTNVYAVSSK